MIVLAHLSHRLLIILLVDCSKMVVPTVKRTIVKKRTKKFIRHQSDRYDKLKVIIEDYLTFCASYTATYLYMSIFMDTLVFQPYLM